MHTPATHRLFPVPAPVLPSITHHRWTLLSAEFHIIGTTQCTFFGLFYYLYGSFPFLCSVSLYNRIYKPMRFTDISVRFGNQHWHFLIGKHMHCFCTDTFGICAVGVAGFKLPWMGSKPSPPSNEIHSLENMLRSSLSVYSTGAQKEFWRNRSFQ